MMKKVFDRLKIKKRYHESREYLKNTFYFILFQRLNVNPNMLLAESRSGEDFAGNIFYLAQEFSKHQITVYVPYKEQYKPKIQKILQTGCFAHVKLIPIYSYRYYFLLAVAKYLINDVAFDWKYLKRDQQIYINTWHGTPLKTLGYDVISERYIMGNIQRNLLMADYITTSSDYFSDKILSAYHNQYINKKTRFLLSGFPRNSVFFDDINRQLVRKRFDFNEKQIIVYMPTWRGSHLAPSHTNTLQNYLSEIDKALTDKQVLFVKLHNLDKQSITLDTYNHIKYFPDTVESYEFLSAADCLVTDYSSVFFDFANTKKKIILFTYDEKEYFKDRGVYFSLDELPFPRVYNVQDLIYQINTEKLYDDTDFLNQYCTYDQENAPKKIVSQVLGIDYTLEEKKYYEDDDKKNILIYCGGINLKNGIITALKSLLNNVDTEKCHYYLSFVRSSYRVQPEIVKSIRPDILLYPISSPLQKTIVEAVAYHMYYYKKTVKKRYLKYWNRLMKRENKKIFPDNYFDIVIDFEGYGTHHVLPLLQQYPGKRIVFVHNDMVREIEVRKNQHPYILRDIYSSFDRVAIVTEDIRQPTVQISGREDNIRVINNIHNDQDIKSRGKLPILLDKDTEVTTWCPEGVSGVLKSHGYKFITIGRFSPEKGHIRLLNAFDIFCDRYTDAQLIIIGGHGNLYNTTLKHIKKMRHWRNITIIKSLTNPMPILKQCDLFILSSFYEGLGLVLLEADSLGVPALSTNINGPRLFMQQYHGHLVDNNTYGLLHGMYDFVDGKVHTFDIDYAKYNQYALASFEKMIEV